MGLSQDQPSETVDDWMIGGFQMDDLWMIFPFKSPSETVDFLLPPLIPRGEQGSSYLREGRGLSTFLLDVSKNPWRVTCLCQIILELYIYI